MDITQQSYEGSQSLNLYRVLLAVCLEELLNGTGKRERAVVGLLRSARKLF